MSYFNFFKKNTAYILTPHIYFDTITLSMKYSRINWNPGTCILWIKIEGMSRFLIFLVIVGVFLALTSHARHVNIDVKAPWPRSSGAPQGEMARGPPSHADYQDRVRVPYAYWSPTPAIFPAGAGPLRES